MARPLDISLGTDKLTIDSGALTSDTFAQFQKGGLSLLSDLMSSAAAAPIGSLTSDSLEAGIRTGVPLKWQLGPVSLEFSPNVQGTLTIRKAGEVFRFTEAENDDDEAKRQIITVPPNKAYVLTAFRVNIGVSGGSGFSNGPIGIKGSAETSDTFLLANHCQVDAAMSVRDAVKEAFQRFVLPFAENAYRDIRDGDLVEYEFYGKISAGVESALGFNGVFFGGMSGGEVRRSFNSPIGSVTAGARPEFDLSANFSVRYQHEDAFRIVLRGLTDRARLFVFKMDQSVLSAGLKLSAGVTLNTSVDLQLQVDDLINKAASRLFERVPDESLRNTLVSEFTKRVKSSKADLNRYVQEAQQRIADQLLKLNRLKVSAAATFERISKHACLLSIEFDKAAPSAGFKTAIQGDLAGALTQSGAHLVPGSYTRAEIRRTTALSFQLFETFKATSIRTYFDQSELKYVGNGMFQFRLTTGVSVENNVFGHRKAIEFYFEIAAAAAANGAISDRDIHLHIKTTDQNDVDAAMRTAGLLHLILKNTAFAGLDHSLNETVALSPTVIVNLELVFQADSYRRLPFSAFLTANKPAVVQAADASNYAAFVDAVDLIYAGSGFGTQGFPDQVARYKNWAHYNVTANDQENAGPPANRRARGNGNTDSVWPQDGTAFPAAHADRATRPMLRAYMLAVQQFMNFCEDLPGLAKDLDEATTREALNRVLDQAKDLVKEGAGNFPIFFTKPFAAALVAQCGGVVQEVQAPAGAIARDTFDVRITIG